VKKLVVLTGSGISAESGLKTFRDSGGLWEEYDVMEVASYEGWLRNPELVQRFYNERRQQLKDAIPNDGHKGLVKLEKYFDVQIITQNVDDLHEKAGSSKVLHLHGILTSARSTADPALVYNIGYEPIKSGQKCEKGSLLRPDIVWFGEPVPLISEAVSLTERADIFVVIGTSLVVYPAAGLMAYVPEDVPVFLIDPNDVKLPQRENIVYISEGAASGVKKLYEKLIG